jgi:4-amino-4-deoxy-L-arabinose transferase-like glycosyltransferase
MTRGARAAEALAVAVLAGAFLAAALPHLGRFPPPLDWGELEIAATARSLAEAGVYGNPLFTGFAASERRYYVFMPMYPVLLAGVFKAFGVGLAQARGLSVACGLATLLLTWRLGRSVHGPAAGLAAAAVLCVARLAFEPSGSGVPLLGLAHVVRFDILVPVFVLSACLAFLGAAASRSLMLFASTGALVGLAVLSHVWGGLLLPVLLGLLAWRRGRGAALPGALLLLGFLLALAPWVAFVLQDPESFVAQMRRHQGRFEVWSPAWYLANLLHEHWRYAPWVGGAFRHPVLWPRLGLWVVILGVVAGNLALAARARRDPANLGTRLVLLAVPVMALLMGLLVNQKRYPYTLLVLPFLALQAGAGLVELWRLRPMPWAAAALCLGCMVETGSAQASYWAAAREAPSYAAVASPVARLIPVGSRALIPHPLWLALPGRQTRSLVLPHFLADRRLHPGGGAPTMDAALAGIAPDFVVLEDRFTRYVNPANPRVEELWRQLTAAVQRLCPEVAGRFEARVWEPAAVHRCASPGSGA